MKLRLEFCPRFKQDYTDGYGWWDLHHGVEAHSYLYGMNWNIWATFEDLVVKGKTKEQVRRIIINHEHNRRYYEPNQD